MALTKSDIVNKIRAETGISMRKTFDTIETLLELLKSNLASGEDILISGFGKFSVKDKKKRRGRNPATGEDLILKSRKVVTFKCSGKLREKINGQ